jgi:hypothetical protein
MSQATDRLSRLRRDLWQLKERIKSFDNGRCEGERFADEIQEVLDADQARIGKQRDEWD